MLHSTFDAARDNRLRKTRSTFAAPIAISLLLSFLVISPLSAAPPKASTTPTEVNEESADKKGWFQRRKEAKAAREEQSNSTAATTGSKTKTNPTSKAKPPRTGGGWFDRSAPPISTSDTLGVVRLQIFLDQSHFGPGKIDGSLGGFTNKAVANYNRSRGIEPDNWYYVIRDASRAVREAHTTYAVRTEDWNHVGSLSYEPAEQAENTYMPYRSMAELISERFHTSENYIASANPEINLSRLKTGAEVIVPNVAPFRIEDVALNQKFPKETALSSRHLIVDTREKVAFIHEADANNNQILVAAFPITPGAERYIPYGSWNIDSMVTTPTFRYDKQMLQEGVRGEEFFMLPPGPNSPVGIFWAGLTKSGIGLHGTNNPDTIGRAQSAGCIRLANWDAIRLSQFIRPGATVEVK